MSITASAGIRVAVLALGIALRPAEAQQQPAVHVPKSMLDRYVGQWVYPDGETVMVRRSGDTLFREVPGQRVPFVPISPTLFRLGPVFTAEFVVDQSGGITQILTDGVDIEYRLSRKGSRAAALPAAPAPAVRVPRAVLERYVGDYEFVPGQMKRTDLSMVVRLRGDTLTRQMTGGPEMVLTPITETQFKVGSTLLVTEFVFDDAGVTQVMGWGFQQLVTRLKSKR